MSFFSKTLTLGLCTLAISLSANDVQPNKHKHLKADSHIPPAQAIGGKDNFTFGIDAAYTYWQPFNNAIIYDAGWGTDGSIGNSLSTKNNAVSGFKVGICADLSHDKWLAAANYTWFYHNPNFQENTVFPDVVYTYVNGNYASLASAQSKYKVQFNRVDGMLSRNIFVGYYLVFKPWLGLLGAWDTQAIKYKTVIAETLATTDQKIDQDWWGIGPYAGTKATYYLNNNLGLFISSGASLLLTNRKSTYYSNLIVPQTPDENQLLQNKNTSNDQEVMIEASLGALWEGQLANMGYNISLAWDMQTYLQHFVEAQFISGAALSYTNYSMQGLTVSAGICF